MATIDPKSWQALLLAAKKAWGQTQVHDALQLCDRAALLGDAARYGAAMLRGNILLDLGDAAGALSSYDSIAEPSVPDSALDAARGLALLELARFAEAENALNSALRGAPNNADALFALGLIAELHHSGREAELFRRARKLNPKRFPVTPRLKHESFEAVVAEALGGLPPTMRKFMTKVPVLVAEVPHPDEIKQHVPPVSPLAFGMWVALTGDGIAKMAPLPQPRGMLLFKRNLERASANRTVLVEHIQAFVQEELEEHIGPENFQEPENAGA